MIPSLLVTLGLLGAPEAGAVDPAAAPPARTASNVVFAEPLGNGLLYSLNYARVVESWHLGLRAGASYFTYAVSKYGGSGKLTIVTLPLVASYYVPIAGSNHNVELGLGATVLYVAASTDSEGTRYGRVGLDVAATGVVGWRYLPRDGGLTFGAGFTPLVRTTKVLPWGGLSAGYVF